MPINILSPGHGQDGPPDEIPPRLARRVALWLAYAAMACLALSGALAFFDWEGVLWPWPAILAALLIMAASWLGERAL